MLHLPETRFELAGDEYIYAEISKDMSAESNFKVLAITNELRKQGIPGLIEICPSNASYLVRFNPDVISGKELLQHLQHIDISKSNPKELSWNLRIVEIPTWYNDPITKEYSERFRSRHQCPELSNFEYAMKLNGFRHPEEFIEAHSRTPYLLTMLGFMPGTAWEFPLGVMPGEIIQTPKYLSPRTDTPELAVGIGGAFTVVYPVAGPGSYQLIGRSAVPVSDLKQQFEPFSDSIFLARPGDIWKHRPIDEKEYFRITGEVRLGLYRYKVKEVNFSVESYFLQGKTYIDELMKGC